jgi:hypothetical protein
LLVPLAAIAYSLLRKQSVDNPSDTAGSAEA